MNGYALTAHCYGNQCDAVYVKGCNCLLDEICRLMANLRLQEVPVLLPGFISWHAYLIMYSS